MEIVMAQKSSDAPKAKEVDKQELPADYFKQDEYAGQGGSFSVDPVTGKRTLVKGEIGDE